MRSRVLARTTPLRIGFRRCLERRVPLAVGLYGVFAAALLELSEAFLFPNPSASGGFGTLAVILLCGVPVVALLRFLGRP